MYISNHAFTCSGLLSENPKLSSTNLFPEIMKVLNSSQAKLRIFGNYYSCIKCLLNFNNKLILKEIEYLSLLSEKQAFN